MYAKAIPIKKESLKGDVIDQQSFFAAVCLGQMNILLDKMWPRLNDEGRLVVLKHTMNYALPVVAKKDHITAREKRDNLYEFLYTLLAYEQLYPDFLIKFIREIGLDHKEYNYVMDLLIQSLKYSKYDEKLHVYVFFILQKNPKGSEFHRTCLRILEEHKILSDIFKKLVNISPLLLNFFEDYLDEIIPQICNDRDVSYLIEVLDYLGSEKSLVLIEQNYFLISDYLQRSKREDILGSHSSFEKSFKKVEEEMNRRSNLIEYEKNKLLLSAKVNNLKSKKIKISKKTAKMHVKYNFDPENEEQKEVDQGEGVLSIESILALQNIDYSSEDGFKLVVSSSYKEKKPEQYIVIIKKKESKPNIPSEQKESFEAPTVISSAGDIYSDINLGLNQKNKAQELNTDNKPINQFEDIETSMFGVFDPIVAPIFFHRLEAVSYIERGNFVYEIHHVRDLARDIVYYPTFFAGIKLPQNNFVDHPGNIVASNMPTVELREMVASVELTFRDPEYLVTADDMLQVANVILHKSNQVIFIPSIDVYRSEGFGSLKEMLDNELLDGTFRVAAVNVLANGLNPSNSFDSQRHWLYTLTYRFGDKYFAIIINTLGSANYSESINLIREQIAIKYNNLEMRVINTEYQNENSDFSSCGIWVLSFLERTVAFLNSMGNRDFSLDELQKSVLLTENSNTVDFISNRRQAYADLIEEGLSSEEQIADGSYELGGVNASRAEHIFQDLLSYFRNNSIFSSDTIDLIEAELGRELMVDTSSNLRGREFEYEYLRRICRTLDISIKILDEEQHHYHEVSSGSNNVIEIRYTETGIEIRNLFQENVSLEELHEDQLMQPYHVHQSNITLIGNDMEADDYGLYNLFYSSLTS